MGDKNNSSCSSGFLPISEIQSLADVFKENDLEELVIETESVCIRFSKGRKSFHAMPFVAPLVQQIPPVDQPQIQQVSRLQPRVSAEPAQTVKPEDPFADETKYHKLKSPINGTFYRSPSPGADPFVKEGDHVNAGQTLCIVEAMKVMNEVKAPVSGKVVKIVRDNAEVVKSEDVLMIIEMV